MPKIITVAHQKGGVGKSTIALNLAMCFQDQLNVALVDNDLQGSLSHFKNENPSLNIFAESDISAVKALEHELVVIDTPPYLTKNLSELFLISDFVLIPTKAGFFDVMAIRDTLELVREAQNKHPALKYGVVLNMVKHRSGITEEVKDLLHNFEAPMLEAIIYDRVSFARSPISGGVFSGEDEKAKEEMTALAEEIVNVL